MSEGRGWFQGALAEAPALAKALYYAGYLAWIQGDYPIARSQLEEITPPTTTPAPERPPAGEPRSKLTCREKEIATLLGRGLTNRQIAEELVISERTVDTHVRNVLKKLGLDTRLQVAA